MLPSWPSSWGVGAKVVFGAVIGAMAYLLGYRLTSPALAAPVVALVPPTTAMVATLLPSTDAM